MIRCPQCDHFNIEGVSVCERCNAQLPAPAKAQPGIERVRTPFETELLDLAATSGTIAAIKRYRSQTGQGLKESKEAVEALLRAHNVAPKQGCSGLVLLAISLTGAAVGLIWRA